MVFVIWLIGAAVGLLIYFLITKAAIVAALTHVQAAQRKVETPLGRPPALTVAEAIARTRQD